MFSALTQTELFALLAAGQTVLVPHAQAARVLRSRFQQQSAASAPDAEPGAILAWIDWTTSLWSHLLLDGADDRVLLNRVQEMHLWATIITARTPAAAATSRFSIRAQARLARSGLRLAAAYNATDRLRISAEGSDTRSFAVWADTFRDHCTRQRLLAPAFLEGELTRHIRAGTCRAPAELHLVGFERLTPAQRDLLAALEQAGTQIQAHQMTRSGASAEQNRAFTVPTARDQILFAAHWVAQHAARGAATFALVTPHPEEHRAEFERRLRQVLSPELEPVGADLSSTPWQFAAGPPLSNETLVAHALIFLRWIADPLSLDRVSQILLSPYFRFSDSAEARSRFGANLRRNGRMLRPELDLAQLPQLLRTASGGKPSAQLPEWRAAAKYVEQKSFRQGARQHAEWAELVRSLLALLGWPGPRQLTPAEFAATEAWDRALDLLATLDLNAKRIPFAAFLQLLEDEAGRPSPAASAPVAPIQILCLPETEGLVFDHVLVLDATDHQLPAPEPAHALLARRLQRSLDMPGADPARNYAASRDRLRALIARCTSLDLLAPAHDATGPLRLTRLAQELPFQAADGSVLLASIPAPHTLETAEVEETPLPPLPSPVVPGGARVLELQSACGFRAFAELRLRAEEPSHPGLGLEAREAGSRLHEALQRLWQELKDQVTLRSMPTSDRERTVRQAVQQALQPLAGAPGSDQPWARAFLPVLEHRFVRLLMQWLDLELQRAPFTVLAQEQGRQMSIGPLQLSVRPDRVDQVNGGLVFIDYKTRYTLSTDEWLGTRPDAPQLPLYTLLAERTDVRGLAFAHVRVGKDMGWLSLSDRPGLFPKSAKNTEADLPTDIAFWREELTRLAQAFADGEAAVDPKSFPTTCQYCAQRLLCRLDPTALLAQITEEEEDVEEEIHG